MHGIDRVASQVLRRDLTIAARTDSRANDTAAVTLPPESVEILHPQEKPLHSPFGTQPHPLAQADTVAFIERLHGLAELDDQALTSSLKPAPEQSAASSLFVWQEPIVVTRAPGRCDVLGGFGGVQCMRAIYTWSNLTVPSAALIFVCLFVCLSPNTLSGQIHAVTGCINCGNSICG